MRKIYLFNIEEYKLLNLLKTYNYDFGFVTNEMLKIEDILEGKQDK